MDLHLCQNPSLYDAGKCAWPNCGCAAPDDRPGERGQMSCGHHNSLARYSAETGEFLFCELCDARSGRRDAERQEQLYLRQRDDSRATIADLTAEIARLREALALIERLHIPDQPAAYGGDELLWAERHVSNLRQIARRALAPTEAEGKSDA